MDSRLPKVMLPNPVTGSQPTAVWNPELLQYGEPVAPLTDEQHMLLPEYTSLNLFVLYGLYSVGLMNPTVPSPDLCRSALIRDIMPARTGAEADVPYT